MQNEVIENGKFESYKKMFEAYAISPLDGRYFKNISFISEYFSEFALIKKRIFVEIQWLHFLCGEDSPIGFVLNKNIHKALDKFHDDFSLNDFFKFKELETSLNHDVKPVEYLLRDILKNENSEFIHFGITSEDVTNLSYALLFNGFKENYLMPHLENIISSLKQLALASKTLAIPGRTHGQPATPTTLGKEFAYFVQRLQNSYLVLKNIKIEAKFSGAVGNYAALKVAYPDLNWIDIAKNFITKFGFEINICTKQIEPHDWIARHCNEIQLISTILIDLCKDIWLYGSYGYIGQKAVEGEIGSSTMPHKVNPIDFENCWGNMELTICLSQLFSRKLPSTFLQRDLSDSTVLRNFGVLLGHFELGLYSLKKGFDRIQFNEKNAEQDLAKNTVVLAEAIQTILRKCGVKNGYEIMKQFTRGKDVTYEQILNFIQKLDIPQDEKEKLLKLKPGDYIGESIQIVEQICK